AREHPHAALEEGHADLLTNPTALARQQRGGDRSRHAEAGHVVAHAGPLCRRWSLGLTERGHDPGTRPERGVVERGPIALRARRPVARQPGIHQPWVHRVKSLEIHPEPGELVTPEVREEDVAP